MASESQLDALESKIQRALALLSESREARHGLEAEISRLKRELAEGERERSEVRRRLERLVKQIDSLSGE